MSNSQNLIKYNPLQEFGFTNTTESVINSPIKEIIPSFISELTSLMAGGYRAGTLNVLAANSGCGKTWFAINEAINAAVQKKYTLLISTEIEAEDVYSRIIAILFKVEIKDFDKISETIKSRLQKVDQLLSTQNLITIESLTLLTDPNNPAFLEFGGLAITDDLVNQINKRIKPMYQLLKKFLLISYDRKVEKMFENLRTIASYLESIGEKICFVVIDHCDFMSSTEKEYKTNEMQRDIYFLENMSDFYNQYKCVCFVVKQQSKPSNSVFDIFSMLSDAIRGTRHWSYISSQIIMLSETENQRNSNEVNEGWAKALTLTLAKRRYKGEIKNKQTGAKIKGNIHEIAYNEMTGSFKYLNPIKKSN